MTDKFIIKKILSALDGKYDTVCTLIQMMSNYKDLKPTEVIGRIVAHEMSLKDKESTIRTRDEVLSLVSSRSNSPARAYSPAIRIPPYPGLPQ